MHYYCETCDRKFDASEVDEEYGLFHAPCGFAYEHRPDTEIESLRATIAERDRTIAELREEQRIALNSLAEARDNHVREWNAHETTKRELSEARAACATYQKELRRFVFDQVDDYPNSPMIYHRCLCCGGQWEAGEEESHTHDCLVVAANPGRPILDELAAKDKEIQDAKLVLREGKGFSDADEKYWAKHPLAKEVACALNSALNTSTQAGYNLKRTKQRLQIADEQIARLAARVEKLEKALRDRCIQVRHSPGGNIGSAHNYCTLCDGCWSDSSEERHSPGCLAAPTSVDQTPDGAKSPEGVIFQ